MDESGHDHKQMPYEVRGGIALHASKLWSFVTELRRLERDCYGTMLSEFKKEIKGSNLLDKDRFKWASQEDSFDDHTRQSLCRKFFTKGLEKKNSHFSERSAYGQASLLMAKGVFSALNHNDAVLFASAIPKGVKKPKDFELEEYLRKDHVFLFERFYYFLDIKKDHGLIVMDEVEKSYDRKFTKRIENYFVKTVSGRARSRWIIPTPLFVASDMAYPVQVADLCIYCINWAFRLPGMGMDADMRGEIKELFGSYLNDLQFKGQVVRDGQSYDTYGIVYVPDPYTGRNG